MNIRRPMSVHKSMSKTKTKRRQDARIEIRCRADEKAELEWAAGEDDRPLSNWLLHLGLKEAKRLRRAR